MSKTYANREERRKNRKPVCGVTRKVRFASQDSALIRASEFQVRDGTPMMMRAYYCQFCGGFHLTSKEARQTRPNP